MARSRSAQSSRRRVCDSSPSTASSASTALAGNAFGSVLPVLGRATMGIGLAGISSALNRKSHRVFHVDQQRRIEAAAWVSANTAKAVRSASRVMSARARAETSAPPAMISATPSKSRQYADRVCIEGLRVPRSARNSVNHAGRARSLAGLPVTTVGVFHA